MAKEPYPQTLKAFIYIKLNKALLIIHLFFTTWYLDIRFKGSQPFLMNMNNDIRIDLNEMLAELLKGSCDTFLVFQTPITHTHTHTHAHIYRCCHYHGNSKVTSDTVVDEIIASTKYLWPHPQNLNMLSSMPKRDLVNMIKLKNMGTLFWVF